MSSIQVQVPLTITLTGTAKLLNRRGELPNPGRTCLGPGNKMSRITRSLLHRSLRSRVKMLEYERADTAAPTGGCAGSEIIVAWAMSRLDFPPPVGISDL